MISPEHVAWLLLGTARLLGMIDAKGTGYFSAAERINPC